MKKEEWKLYISLMLYALLPSLYMLFRKCAFIMDMPFVIRMFGGGMEVHLLVSAALYKVNFAMKSR